ncbi:MAG: DUF805 domain-containing protein [Aeriscardovia sp.]|nr:DUF805 domain-containing protein [Aeriscardovia sp.]MBQ1427726.1 DUF805 domain-containing protein [Aeriscardovia sp.]
MDKYDPLPDCTFGQAIARFFKKYVQFKGAASRSEFWWAFLFTFGVGVILRLISLPCHVLDILVVLWELAVIIPDLSITCRRLHDGGFSGKLNWLYLVPVLGEITLLVLCAFPTRYDRWKDEWFAETN